MPAIIILIVAGLTLVGTRLYLNGRQGAETAAERAPASESTPGGTSAAQATAATRPQPTASAAPSSGLSGGRCPSCGTKVYHGAKFCGECGRRLVPGSKR